MPEHALPFAAIAAAALSRADALVAEWLPGGRREGPEWKALNPTRHDGKIGSFSVNLITGAWGDFACDDKGGDLVSLYAYVFHGGDHGKAAVELADRFGIALPPLEKGKKRARKVVAPASAAAPATAPESKPPRTWWAPVRPVPVDAPAPPKAHPHRGVPHRMWMYREADGALIGYICRFIASDGGKDDIPLCFARYSKSGKSDWRWMAFADPRPLFGLDRAATMPEASLLFVEGEKCREAAQALLPDLAVLSWPGGCNGVGKVDFSSLADRPVKKALLWPDADAKRDKLTKAEREAGVDAASKPLLPIDQQPGTKAMRAVAEKLRALGFKVWMIDIPPPGEKPDGWDIADAIAEGMDGPLLADHLRAQARLWSAPAEPAVENAGESGEPIPPASDAGAGQERKRPPWIPELIYKDGEIKSCLANVYQVLAFHPAWKGVIAFDEMSLCTVKRKQPPYPEGRVGEWDAQDDTFTAIWISRTYGFTPASVMVLEVVEALGKTNKWHPVREWLRSLKWDGTKRLNGWLTKYLGVPFSPYSKRVAAWWLMGLVKRIFAPGTKFDYCLVLSGPQGKKKSTTFAVLGGEWFGDAELDLSSKDSMIGLRGKMIHEFAELGSLTRSDEKRQKSFLSRAADEYRPPYGTRMVRALRQLVFGGSTNEHEWNKDPTGGRRFWPVDCLFDEIDIEGLRSVRDQLFAEALARIDAGERYWPTAEEQRTYFDVEQLRVEQQDSIIDAIHDWVFVPTRAEFSLFDVASECLKLDAAKLTRDLQIRIGVALRKLGCTRVERRNGMIRFWYKPPVRNEASSTTGQADWEGDDVPL